METRAYMAKRIKEFRTKRAHITANQLGELLIPPRSGKTISSWETNRTAPDPNTLSQLAQVFSVPISYFYPPEVSQDLSQEGFQEVPLFGSIAAGTPLAIIPVEDTYPIPVEMIKKHPRGFLLRVEGESMNNVLPNGSYALIDPDQSEAEDKAAYAICVNGADATIKRVKHLANGVELIPDSKDTTFKSKTYDYAKEDPDELLVIGKVVWMMHPFTWQP